MCRMFKEACPRNKLYLLCLGVSLGLCLYILGPSACGSGSFSPSPEQGGMVCFDGEQAMETILRFHVRAGSNSVQDQRIKNEVAAQILKFHAPAWGRCANREELYRLLAGEQAAIGMTARRILRERGFSEDVTVLLGRSTFPARLYGTIYYPPGEYESLIVTIGAGKGENWWCVIFPPLCFNVVPSPAQPAGTTEQGGDGAGKGSARPAGYDHAAPDCPGGAKKGSDTTDNGEKGQQKKWRFWVAELVKKNCRIFAKN